MLSLSRTTKIQREEGLRTRPPRDGSDADPADIYPSIPQ